MVLLALLVVSYYVIFRLNRPLRLLSGAAVKVAQRDSRIVEMYLFVAVVYFVLCYAMSYMAKRLQQKIAIVH